ncbi:MAG: GAF domain-containing protein, partial [Clostridiales bacterium]|nr:GAF domain-containing protein [Clostridiales bacterium]
MEIKKKSILSPIKRIILILIFAIFTALFIFIYLQNQSSKNEYEDKQIINIFGKQRMYTQLMSKEANILYMYLQSSAENDRQQDTSDSANKIIEVKESIMDAKEDFASTLASIDEGYLYLDSYKIYIEKSVTNAHVYLQDINSIWYNFDDALNTILLADGIDAEVEEAITFINQNNTKLLTISDKILNVILADSNASTNRIEVQVYLLVGAVIMIILIGLFNLIYYIVLPFNRIYQGISGMGLTSFTPKLKFPTKKKVAPIIEELNDIFVKFNDLKSLIENMNNNGSFMETLNFINETFSSLIPYNYIGISLFDEDKNLIKASYGVSDGTIVGLPENIVGLSWPVEDTSLGRLIRSGKARIINDLERYTANRPIKPYNSMILDAGVRASITLPLNLAGEPIGVIFFSSAQKNVYKEE